MMMNRQLKDFLAGHDRKCEKYQLADKKAYVGVGAGRPPPGGGGGGRGGAGVEQPPPPL